MATRICGGYTAGVEYCSHGGTFRAMEIESVWDYPRPPRVEPAGRRVRIELDGRVVAESDRALRVLETSHPPAYYVPAADFAPGALEASPKSSFCEFKGRAEYFTLVAGRRRADDAGWGYPNPSPGYEELKDHVSVYAARVDGCWVGDEQVVPQSGDFYGGWVTSWVTGPFKGGAGTAGW